MNELEEMNTEEEVIVEEVDQIPDFTLETVSQKRRLLKLIVIIWGVSALYYLLRMFDHNAVFNPVNSNLFQYLLGGVIILSAIFFVDQHYTKKEDYKNERQHRTFKRYSETLDFFIVMPFLMLVFTIVNMFFVSFSPISGTSMEPNLHDDEAVIFSHLSSEYERFDVVIIYVDQLTDPYLIKRIIGLPGETVVVDDNEIYVDGNLIEQDFIDQTQIETLCYGTTNLNYCSFDVPEDSYFVMGDNRDGRAVIGQVNGHSVDSRSFGSVHIEDIFGKVIITFKDYNLLD